MTDTHSLKLLVLADAEAAHTRRWVNWFAKRNIEVHLVTFNRKFDFGYDPKVNIHLFSLNRLNAKFARPFKGLFITIKLAKLINKLKPNVIHSHSVTAYSWIPAILGVNPLIITPWGTEIMVDIKKSKLNYLITKYSLKKAKLVTTDAKHFIPQLENLGVKKSIYLPFGTDTDIFKPLQGKNLRRTRTLISTRTLNQVHDVGLLISAIPAILQAHPSTKIIIVGGGAQKLEFEKQIQAQGTSDNVEFTGMLSESELLEKLQQSDLYISTSPLDAGLAASTAEAMSTGLPVVVNDTADNKMWVTEEGGYLFENHSVESLSEKTIKLLSLSSEDLDNMGQRNRNLILKSNSLNTSMMNMLLEYQSLADKLR